MPNLMTRPADLASLLLRVLLGIGLIGLALITWLTPGATRMFAWPWSLAYDVALLAPALGLVVRAFPREHPLVLPPQPWSGLTFLSGAVVLISALTSPYPGPSLQASAPLLSALALFLLVYDARQPGGWPAHRLTAGIGLFFVITMVVSLGTWLPGLAGHSLTYLAYGRNPHPLGHANYTAGLALMALAGCWALSWQGRGRARFAWGIAAATAGLVLLSSGSRGGLLALGAFALATLVIAPFTPRKKVVVGCLAFAAAVTVLLVHPRTRELFLRSTSPAEPNASNVQRSAMFAAGLKMGTDRPILGWGPGTTPLVYPRYRGRLVGGAENVLQLHSTPLQIWAELGLAGLAAGAAWLVLLVRAQRQAATEWSIAFAWLVGVTYACFAVTDWQLDVPVFGFALALNAALLAPRRPDETPPRILKTPGRRTARATGLLTLLVLAGLSGLGHRDPAPALNVAALTLAREETGATEAIARLRESLGLNPDQEIAHFNLGWLLLIREPTAAERHFRSAAHLVPDKGGVYFGLGLARLNQGQAEGAAHAIALECLNDPTFLISPWWREPAIAALRDATERAFTVFCQRLRPAVQADPRLAAQLDHVARRAPQLGRGAQGPERSYRRERTGYPVLMRNLDLPAPTDLFDVREWVTPPAPAPDQPALPAKGWLPSPLLLTLLEDPLSPTP